MKNAFAIALLGLCAMNPLFGQSTPSPTATPWGVWTQHNDNLRTGADLSETDLKVENVAPGRFGRLFSLPVSDEIFAQPLYLSDQTIQGVRYEGVLYVATVDNRVFAFDAEEENGGKHLWERDLLRDYPGETTTNSKDIPCEVYGDILGQHPVPGDYGTFHKNIGGAGYVGILGTPVIDRGRGVMYLISRTDKITRPKPIPYAPVTQYIQRLFALDIHSGENYQNFPASEIPGDHNDGQGTFLPQWQNQRSALAFSNNQIYAAWAGECDTNYYHGWVMAFNADPGSRNYLRIQKRFNDTRDSPLEGEGGGIWQAGQGPAVDGQGNLYVMTGNGDMNKYRRFGNDLGNSFIKLGPDLSVRDYFSPNNQRDLDSSDYDLGSAGPLLIPTGSSGRGGVPQTLVLGGGKECKVYLLDPGHLGGFDCNRDHVYQEAYINPSTYLMGYPLPSDDGQGACLTNHIHGGPVFWESESGKTVYVWPENEYLKAYRLDGERATFSTGLIANSYSAPTTALIPRALFFPGTGVPMAVFPSFVPREAQTTSRPKNAPTQLPVATPTAQSTMTACTGMPGGILSLSANGEDPQSGIVWANLPLQDAYIIEKGNVPGMLAAFDARDLKLLWSSEMDSSDKPGDYAKYVPPTIAHGKVYLATFSKQVVVYGRKDPLGKKLHKKSTPKR